MKTLTWLAMTVLLLVPGVAGAHHILGIPHYAYSEEYPQVPFVEVLAQVGPRDLDFTYYPGTPNPGDSVRFKLYIHDRETGDVFHEPMWVEVHRKRFLGRTEPVGEPFLIKPGVGPESNDYKFYLTFDDAEAYQIQLSYPDGDRVEMIPFPVIVGQTDDRPLILGALGILLGAVVVVAIVKRRQRGSRRTPRQEPAEVAVP